MSNALALAEPAKYLITAWVLLGPFLSAFIAWRIGLFRRPLHSRDRIGPDESAGLVALILLATLAAYLLVPSIYVQFRANASTQPTTTTTEISFTSNEQLAISGIAGLSALGVMLIGNALFRPHGLKRLGLASSDPRPSIKAGILGIIFILPILTLVLYMSMALWKALHLQHPDKHELLLELDRNPSAWIKVLIIAMAAILAPVYEEILFRGHFQTLIRHITRRPWVAILLASLAFAIVHPWWMQPPIFVLALCLGYVYERTGSLWAPIIVHCLFNTISLTLSHWF